MSLINIPYNEEFEDIIESNPVIREKYEKLKAINKTQFSYFYHSMSSFDHINDLLARRIINYESYFEKIKPGTVLFEKTFKSKMGLGKLFKDESIVESQGINFIELLDYRGNEKSLQILFKHFNLDLTLDHLIMSDYDVYNDEYILVGDKTNTIYHDSVLEEKIMNEHNQFPIDCFPIPTGLVCPHVIIQLREMSYFISMLDALLIDNNEFMNIPSGDGFTTIRELYTMYQAISNLIGGRTKGYVEIEGGFLGMETYTSVPIYDKYLFRKFLSLEYDLPPLSDAEFNRFTNLLAWTDLEELEYLEYTDYISLEIPTDTVKYIINDLVNKRLFSKLMKYMISMQYEAGPEKISGLDVVGHHTYTKNIKDFIMFKEHPLMFLKRRATANVFKATISLINRYNTTQDVLYIQSVRILDIIREKFNETKPLGDFLFKNTLDSVVSLTLLKNELPNMVPYYIQFLEERIIYKVQSSFTFKHEILRHEHITLKHEFEFSHQLRETPKMYTYIEFSNLMQYNLEFNSEFEFGYNFNEHKEVDSEFEFTNTIECVYIFYSYFRFRNRLVKKERIFIKESTKPNFNFYRLLTNSDTSFSDISVGSEWKFVWDDIEDDLSWPSVRPERFEAFTTINKYDNFRMDCVVGARDSSNDGAVVIVLGLYKDPINSRISTISVVRSNNPAKSGVANNDHTGGTWKLWYNYHQNTRIMLKDLSALVPVIGGVGLTWNDLPGGHFKIHFEKMGGIYKVATSKIGDPYDESKPHYTGDVDYKNSFILDLNKNHGIPGQIATQLRNPISIGFGIKDLVQPRFTDVYVESIDEFSPEFNQGVEV